MAFPLQLGDKMLGDWDSSFVNSSSGGKASRSPIQLIEVALRIAVKVVVLSMSLRERTSTCRNVVKSRCQVLDDGPVRWELAS